jgi:hypothetical protein
MNTPSMRPRLLLLAGVLAGPVAAGVVLTSASVDGDAATAAATTAAAPSSPSATAPPAAARAAFLSQLRGHCGKAYAGRIVADTPASADNPFAGKTLVMHVRDCGAEQIRIPFHVGDDRSRTWVITPLEDGQLRLKHDHRHADGSADALTMYGGQTQGKAANSAGSWRYEFPADAESKAMFQQQDRAVSIPNVWALELDAKRFVYELARPGRLFRAEFDLSKPQKTPPAPWGAPAGK